MAPISRRDLLKISIQGLLGISSLLGIAGLVRFFSFEPDPPPPQKFEIGAASTFLIDTRTVITQIPAVLIHSADGFIAYSLTCPHLGCTVESISDGFVCPCHGSRYGLNGQLLLGPSAQGLKQLKVELTTDKKIIIYKN